MITITLWIAKQIGFAGCAILAIIAYYEGVPGLRDIPFVDRLPVAREMLAGRVAKVSADAADAATLAERAAWQEVQRLADLAREQERAEAQRRIEAADAHYTAGQISIAARYATLEDILRKERADNAQNNGGACRTRIPDSVWRALNAVGD